MTNNRTDRFPFFYFPFFPLVLESGFRERQQPFSPRTREKPRGGIPLGRPTRWLSASAELLQRAACLGLAGLSAGSRGRQRAVSERVEGGRVGRSQRESWTDESLGLRRRLWSWNKDTLVGLRTRRVFL